MERRRCATFHGSTGGQHVKYCIDVVFFVKRHACTGSSSSCFHCKDSIGPLSSKYEIGHARTSFSEERCILDRFYFLVMVSIQIGYCRRQCRIRRHHERASMDAENFAERLLSVKKDRIERWRLVSIESKKQQRELEDTKNRWKCKKIWHFVHCLACFWPHR